MKQLILFFCMLLSVHIHSQKNELKWSDNFEKTIKKAKRNKKPIIIYFSGSDWCSPCKKLDADFFHSQKFLDQSKKFNLVLVDLPHRIDIISSKQRKKNEILMRKYNKGKSFPMVVFMNYNGNVKEKIKGYSFLRDTSKYFENVEALLN